MAARRVNGGGNGARSGAHALSLLASPLNCAILGALADGPGSQQELQRKTGSPAQTTLRAQLKKLIDVGALEKRRRNSFPGSLEYALAASGRDLSLVADVLSSWLGCAPAGPLKLEDSAARAAIKALAEGWSTTMVRAIAAKPLSLTELDRLIAPLSYPALERRLGALRLTGLVEASPSQGHGVPFTASRWLRLGIAPLAAAARWERQRLVDRTAPVAPIDIEAALLLSVPLLHLGPDMSGVCRVAVELPNGKRSLSGAMVELRDGVVAGCSTDLRGSADAWALGPVSSWFGAVIDDDLDGLELGGDCKLGRELIHALHRVLFHPSPTVASRPS